MEKTLGFDRGEIVRRLRADWERGRAAWPRGRRRAVGLLLVGAGVAMGAASPVWWRGTRAERATTLWPLGVVAGWLWAFVGWLSFLYFKYN